MKISQAFPSDYVKAADLNGKNVNVIIAGVEFVELGGDRKLVLKFQNAQKGMIMNKTNAKNISVLYGDDTDDWIGREVVLFSAWVDFQGKTVEAIRVRGPQKGPQVSRVHEPLPSQMPPPQPASSKHPAFDDEAPF